VVAVLKVSAAAGPRVPLPSLRLSRWRYDSMSCSASSASAS
jgi:hypothetical protein